MTRRIILSVLLAAAVVACGTGTTDTAPAGAPAVRVTVPGTPDIGSWYLDNGYIIDVLSADMEAIAAAAGVGDFEWLGTACAQLAVDVLVAQRLQPIPDAEVEHHWRAALDAYSTGAAFCGVAAADYDVDALLLSSEYMTEGTTSLNAATDAIG